MQETELDQIDIENDRSSYGQACLTCVRSKTKCTAARSGVKCERCRRLKRECQSAPSVRKLRVSKNAKTSVNSTSRGKKTTLEEKLDGIVELLHRNQVQSQTASTQPLLQDTGIGQSQIQLQANHLRSSQPQVNNLNSSTVCSNVSANLLTVPQYSRPFTMAAGSPPTPSPSESIGSVPTPANMDSFNPAPYANYETYSLEDEDECQEYLDTYRTKMSPYCPMVIIKPQVTLVEMREQSPFLWLVIRSICSKNVIRQIALGQEVKRMVAKETLLEATRSMDMLQGILVFVGWYHFYVCRKPIHTSMTYLAISLAADLGITRAIPVEPYGVMLNYTSQGCPKPPHLQNRGPRTIEERRTAVSLFYISALVSHFFQRIDPVNWTPYMEECLSILEEEKDAPTDLLLVYQVRIALIRSRIATVSWADTFPVGEGGKQFPRDFYIQTFSAQLNELRAAIPVELSTSQVLEMHLHEATLSIHEYCLLVTPTKEISFDPDGQMRRMENLYTVFASVKAWFALFNDLSVFPLTDYPNFSMSLYTQLPHALVALYRLSTFNSPDVPWDRLRVVQELHFGNLIREIIQRWKEVPKAAGLDLRGSNDVNETTWIYTSKKLAVLVDFWEATIEPKLTAEALRTGRSVAGRNATLEGTASAEPFDPLDPSHNIEPIDFSAMSLDFMNDDWMRGVLGPNFDLLQEPYW